MAKLYEVPSGLYVPGRAITSEYDPSQPLREITDLEMPDTLPVSFRTENGELVAQPNRHDKLSEQIRQYGYTAIRLTGSRARHTQAMDHQLRVFSRRSETEKMHFHNGDNSAGYCPIHTSTAGDPDIKDHNTRVISGGYRVIPNHMDKRIWPLDMTMQAHLRTVMALTHLTFREIASEPGAHPFFIRAANDEITFIDEPFQQANSYGTARKPTEKPLQSEHRDRTLMTGIFSAEGEGQSSPGLTIEIAPGEWVLLVNEPGEIILSPGLTWPDGTPPLWHYVTNLGRPDRRAYPTFINPDLEQAGLPPDMLEEIHGGDKEFELSDNSVTGEGAFFTTTNPDFRDDRITGRVPA